MVHRRQLIALGLDRNAIARRLAAGRLHALHVGVYAVGYPSAQREARWLAAVLACGPGALLSHRSAAALWQLRDGESRDVDVSVPATAGRRRPRIAIHRVALEDSDRGEFRGIPVITPARTLADLARVVDEDELGRALREAEYRKRFDLEATRAQLARRPSRALGALLEDLRPTRSRLEDRVLPLLADHGLPRPRPQYALDGRHVDFAWPERKVVVETDGWEGHGTRTAFQADRAATNRLQLAGYTVLRFTDADVRRRPRRVAEQIRAALIRSAA